MKKNKVQTKTPKRHGKMVCVRGQLYTAAKSIAAIEATTVTEIVNKLVREGLARLGKWPQGN